MASRFIVLPAAAALLALAAASPAGATTSFDGGVLEVRGGPGDDRLALRHEAGRIEVDVGDDGSAELALPSRVIRAIDVRMGAGEDHVRLAGALPRVRIEGGEGDFDAVQVAAADVRAAGDRALVDGNRFTTVERLELTTDRELVVGDLTGTVVNDVDVDLGADGSPDRVELHGTPGSDFTDMLGQPGGDLFALGLPASVTLHGVDASDRIDLQGRDGDDRMSASSLAAGAADLVMEGGDGDDDLSGTPGAERLLGGSGVDFVEGNGGDDHASLGGGSDIFAWEPGDGSDTVEGRGGDDVLLFRGSGADERFAVEADGRRARVTRDLGSIVMDLGEVEKVEVGLRAGADRLDVGDLRRSGVTWVVAELASGIAGQSLDGAADAIRVEGRGAVAVADTLGGVRVSGLPALVDVLRPEGALDTLTVAGAKSVDSSGLTPGTIGLGVE